MLTSLWCWRGSFPASSLFIFLSQLVLTSALSVSATPLNLVPDLVTTPPVIMNQLALIQSRPPLDLFPSLQQTENEDPLNSPHPVPWSWMMKTQQEYSQQGRSGLRYYRSPALLSPDGQYAAYSRIEMRAEPDLYASKALSVMFLENIKTGELQVIRAKSPIALYLEEAGENSEEMAGVISLLMPVSWSEDGDRLLARQFEGAFSTSDVSDYAVVWNKETQESKTLGVNAETTDADASILLGWSHTQPDQVLFRSAGLGEETESIFSVGLNGQTNLASDEEAVIYGQLINRSWTGVQALR